MTNCITWPKEVLSASLMAEVIDRFVVEHGIHAVSLDGPQGWREPNAVPRKGVGRWCEYQVLAQGKTGVYGVAYPKTQRNWITFCIDVFANLIKMGHARLANDPSELSLEQLTDDSYWLLECFPTSVWRTSKLVPLPGKAKMRRHSLSPWIRTLSLKYGLPAFMNWSESHDDLQAVAATLPGVALLGGPSRAVPRGKPVHHIVLSDQWVEGLIWDCEPDPDFVEDSDIVDEIVEIVDLTAIEADASNPLLVDERDEEDSDLIERGVELFEHLVKLANKGDLVGVGYAQFACCVHDVESFSDIANRNYAQSDTANVLRLAHQVTAAAPRMRVIKNSELEVGMDAFIWRKRPPHPRPSKAFGTEADRLAWLSIFPDGTRRLLDCNLLPKK
jgi:hypothetical protein